MTTSSFQQFPTLTTTTIVPKDDSLFDPYFTRQYESIAATVNFKDNSFYPMAISDIPVNIVNLLSFGAFIICVSGIDSTLPTLTASLCKSDMTAAGQVVVIGSQAGTAAWAGNNLTITSTATNFQIAHDRAGITANFNLRVILTNG